MSLATITVIVGVTIVVVIFEIVSTIILVRWSIRKWFIETKQPFSP